MPAAEAITGYKTEELLAHSIFCQQLKLKECGQIRKQGGSPELISGNQDTD